jgi:hypothetical protein
MKKGIGPQGLGASKSPAKMYGAKSPAKQVNLGNAFGGTKSKLMNENERRLRSDAKRGDKEAMGKLDARDKIKFNARAKASAAGQAYKARENNFGVKKPKANIK